MDDILTESRKSDFDATADAENAPVKLARPAEVISDDASDAGPQNERAEARQHQNRVSAASVTITFNASDITDFKAFIALLRRMGCSRAFAKRAAHGAFPSAAGPSADDQQVTQVIASLFADASAALKGTLK